MNFTQSALVRANRMSNNFGLAVRRWPLRLLLLVAGIALFGALPACAQNNGTIFGTVKDTTGALVPHAAVTVIDAQNGLTRTVHTNGTGEFTLVELPVGTYQLTISMQGFENETISNIVLEAQQNQKETITLRAGSAKDTVTVESESAVLDTRSGTLGAVIDNNLVENLPIDGENVVALAALLPGVTDVSAPVASTTDTNGPTFSANGGRTNQNLMLFDGLMFNNLFFNTGVNYPPHPDLQEVSVILNNYTAQYGRSAGSIFNVITRQGTNTVHGQIWEYLQNQMFNAADYITHSNPEDNYNQFGFQVGGPIIRDKMSFAVGFQQLIARLQQVGDDDGVPTNADRGLTDDGSAARPCLSIGAFPGMTCAIFADQLATVSSGALTYNKLINPDDAGGSGGSQGSPQETISMLNAAWQQYGGTGNNPCLALLAQADAFAAGHPYFQGYNGFQQKSSTSSTSTYLPYGEVPTQCLNPTFEQIVKKYVPIPNNIEPDGQPSAVTKLKVPYYDTNLLGRIDYHFDRHTIDARYNYVRTTATYSLGGNIPTFNPDAQFAYLNFGSIGDTWVITNNLLNTVHIGYKRFENGHTPKDPTTMESLGASFPIPDATPTLPAISAGFSLGTTSTSNASSNQGYLDTINENVEVQESMSLTKGRHSLGWGMNFLRLQYLNRQDFSGVFKFSSSFTRVDLVDGSFGLVNDMLAQNRLNQGGIQHAIFGYVQDAWRATANLTLNYGLRYELNFQWFEPHGESATFVPGAQSTVFPNAPGGLVFPGDKGVLSSLVPTDYNGIAPRLGLAYDLKGNGRFVIRAGGGVFFDAVNANVVGVGEPYHYIINANFPEGGFSNGLQGYPTIPARYDPKNPTFIAPYSIFFPDRNFRTPYIIASNLGFQAKVSRSGTFDMNYVGRFSRKLPIPVDLNPDIYDCSGGYFLSDPARYCTNASSTNQSDAARVRYLDFNYGGQGIVDIKSIGNGNYNALQTMYSQRGNKFLNMIFSYTYSKSIDLSTNGQTISNAVPNVFNVNSDRGLSDTDARHNVAMGWTMRFPNRATGSAVERVITTGWIFSGKFIARTGHPFSVTINDDQALNGEPNQRASLVAGANPRLPSSRHRADKINEWFNVYAFTYPTQGTFSNVPRNFLTGPAYMVTDANFGREFPLEKIRQGMRLGFRAEAFNVFNTPNLNKPSASFSCGSTNLLGGPCSTTLNPNATTNANFSSTSSFGKISSTVGAGTSPIPTNGSGGRKMQFNLVLYF